MLREKAKAKLIKHLDRVPDDADSWLELARLRFSTGDDAGGMSAAERVPPNHPLYPRALLWTLKYLDSRDKSGLDSKVEVLANLLISQGTWELFVDLITLLNTWGYHGVSESLVVTFMRQHGSLASGYLLLGRALFAGGRYELAWQVARSIWPGNEHSFADKIGPMPFQRSHRKRPHADIKDRIDACVAAANTADADIVPYRLGGGDADLDDHRGASILLVGPETNNQVFENEILAYYALSASECGLDVQVHLDDAIVYPENSRTSDAYAMKRLTLLGERIIECAPSLLIVDATYIARSWTITPEFLAGLKRRHKSRIAVIIRDNPHAGLHIALPWAEVVDVVIVFEPRAAILDTAFRAKTLVLPPPLPKSLFGSGEIPAERDLALMFAGTASGFRPMILSALISADIDFTYFDDAHRQREMATVADYTAVLKRSRCCLNFSYHDEDTGGRDGRIATGRVWEAIAAGCALIEQENASTEAFFVPYLHYLPYRGVDEIIDFTCFLECHEEERTALTRRADEWRLAHYGPRRIWGTLLARALA
jgi:hypothetical protein